MTVVYFLCTLFQKTEIVVISHYKGIEHSPNGIFNSNRPFITIKQLLLNHKKQSQIMKTSQGNLVINTSHSFINLATSIELNHKRQYQIIVHSDFNLVWNLSV